MTWLEIYYIGAILTMVYILLNVHSIIGKFSKRFIIITSGAVIILWPLYILLLIKLSVRDVVEKVESRKRQRQKGGK